MYFLIFLIVVSILITCQYWNSICFHLTFFHLFPYARSTQGIGELSPAESGTFIGVEFYKKILLLWICQKILEKVYDFFYFRSG